MANPAHVNIYPLSSYSFGTKEPKMEKDTSVADRLARMKIKHGVKIYGLQVVELLRTSSLFPQFIERESSFGKKILRLPAVNVYPLSCYNYGTKDPKMEKDISSANCLARLKLNYMKEGMKTSVEAILVVQEHNHPHILLLQIGNTFCKLPGGRLKPGENEIEGLKRKLNSKLGANTPGFQQDWKIGECVAVWWRPNFETIMYPYCPPHITKPKECKKLFIVHLSERDYFAVPKNLKLLAVPLFELYDNVQRYGPVISTIPQQLSRFYFKMVQA